MVSIPGRMLLHSLHQSCHTLPFPWSTKPKLMASKVDGKDAGIWFRDQISTWKTQCGGRCYFTITRSLNKLCILCWDQGRSQGPDLPGHQEGLQLPTHHPNTSRPSSWETCPHLTPQTLHHEQRWHADVWPTSVMHSQRSSMSSNTAWSPWCPYCWISRNRTNICCHAWQILLALDE